MVLQQQDTSSRTARVPAIRKSVAPWKRPVGGRFGQL